MANDPRKVIIGTPDKPARSSFMFCRTLKEPEDGEGPARGSCAILFPKSDKKLYEKVKAAIQAAGEKKFGSSYSFSSKKYKSPISDGDELADDPEYTVGEEARGMWFLSSSCYKVPQLVDRQGQRVLDPDAIDDMMRSGNYFLFSVTFKGFDVDKNKGVRAELNNVMFVKEGEHLDGSASAEKDFADYAMDEEPDDDENEDDEDEAPRRSRRESRRESRPSREDRASRRDRKSRR